MSRGINKVILLGNLGRDPEMRSTTGGTIIAAFSVATSDRRKDTQGNWQDVVEWHNIVCFNRTAEIARDYLKKGSQVYLEGKLQTRSWEDAGGIKHYRTEILVSELVLLGQPATEKPNGKPESRPRQGDLEGMEDERPTERIMRGVRQENPSLEITDDDIPF